MCVITRTTDPCTQPRHAHTNMHNNNSETSLSTLATLSSLAVCFLSYKKTFSQTANRRV